MSGKCFKNPTERIVSLNSGRLTTCRSPAGALPQPRRGLSAASRNPDQNVQRSEFIFYTKQVPGRKHTKKFQMCMREDWRRRSVPPTQKYSEILREDSLSAQIKKQKYISHLFCGARYLLWQTFKNHPENWIETENPFPQRLNSGRYGNVRSCGNGIAKISLTCQHSHWAPGRLPRYFRGGSQTF